MLQYETRRSSQDGYVIKSKHTFYPPGIRYSGDATITLTIPDPDGSMRPGCGYGLTVGHDTGRITLFLKLHATITSEGARSRHGWLHCWLRTWNT